ncbi:hypothetical protein Aph01nite_78410 [Acrocarpospora phusangensis]|uniref:Uncharacterized protein n=1 Tax=Acrocarpospora phusangensis TaxID=1070424 RepID=A0A919QIL7_9ACTN|nr:hypothetical protein [Acrocarpospora phusangensis]GIH29531.1 hypothetical protein Aph01nite_78410 [Acrocarpospora phusangensis]
MRKVRAVLVTAVVVLGTSLTIGATPAQADGERVAGIFRYEPDCERVGTQGVNQDWWNDYECEWEGRYRYFFLYA